MSRIAKKPIIIPAKTEASFAAGVMTVKGPLGELKKNFRDDVSITITANSTTGAKEIALATTRNTLQARAMIGTYASHLRNMIAGVSKAYEKKLIVEGIGFKADVKGKELVLNVGFSHPIHIEIPADLKIVSDKTGVNISGIDCEKSASSPPGRQGHEETCSLTLERASGDSDEVIRRKQGKKAA